MRNNNMEEDIFYNVLWIDDQPNEAFQDYAYNSHINIISKTCVKDGLEYIRDQNNIVDAIILDANCIISTDESEVPNINSLQYAITNLYSLNSNIPWFVYTGGSYAGKEALTYIIPKTEYRPWDDRVYYNKPKDREILFENIKKAVQNREETCIRHKFQDVCNIYPNTDLIELLVENEYQHDSMATDATIPNRIRGIIEWIMYFCYDRGVLGIPFNGTNIGECSKFLGQKQLWKYVPSYIQRLLHFLVVYANAGSHQFENHDDEITGESIKTDILNGNAKYVNETAVSALLNVLKWCNTLPYTDEDISDLITDIDFLLSSNNDTNKGKVNEQHSNKNVANEVNDINP